MRLCQVSWHGANLFSSVVTKYGHYCEACFETSCEHYVSIIEFPVGSIDCLISMAIARTFSAGQTDRHGQIGSRADPTDKSRLTATYRSTHGDYAFFTWVQVPTVDDHLLITAKIHSERNAWSRAVNRSKAWASDRYLALLLINEV
jgi:hypothetical protein